MATIPQDPIERFRLYERAVQDPAYEVRFIRQTYRRLRGKSPLKLREDFCGTAILACEWVRRVAGSTSVGVDLDGPTLAWAREHNLQRLGSRAARVSLEQRNVLRPGPFRPDVVAAFNFSYFVFKERRDLGRYFRAVHRTLAPRGVYFLDIHGGPDAQILGEEPRDCPGFKFVWHQAAYNPISGETLCHIHFDVDGRRMTRAFTYDWRLWSLPEVRDLLVESGFRKVHVYWEGTDHETSSGNGVFRLSRGGDNSKAWIAYIVALK